jgi:hypothetical protein
MDVEMNKAHCFALVEDSGEKPIFSELVKLIYAIAGISCTYTKEKAYFFFIPPLSGFSPRIKDLLDFIETFSPNEGGYYGILILVDSYGFADEP